MEDGIALVRLRDVDTFSNIRLPTTTVDTDVTVDVPLLPETESKQSEPAISTLGFALEKQAHFGRAIPRMNTRTSSLAGPLLWKVDKTGTSYTPTSQKTKVSIAAPPKPSYGGSMDASEGRALTASQSYSRSYLPCTPYISSITSTSTGSHIVDLSHPPGYTQDAHASLSGCPSTLTSTSYSNNSPFYQNNSSSSVTLPLATAPRGRGILDKDPNLYLQDEGDAQEDSIWYTAAKWAKAAGKRLSQGEQQIWKMVNAVANGEHDRYWLPEVRKMCAIDDLDHWSPTW